MAVSTLILASAVAVATAVLIGAVAAPRERDRLVWSDDFSGDAGDLPDRARWAFETGANGFGNNELECYTDAPGNAGLDGEGHLLITAIHQPGHVCADGRVSDWTSARITTFNSYSVEHGRLELRAKIPTAAGTWPAFWALGRNIQQVGWPRTGEIDVMEADGRGAHRVLGSVHGPRADGSPWYITRIGAPKANLGSGFHTYAVDWTPAGMSWSVDGLPYGRVTRHQAEQQGEWVFDHRFYLLLNLAVGGDLVGTPPSSTSWPQQYMIDWVRVYRLPGD